MRITPTAILCIALSVVSPLTLPARAQTPAVPPTPPDESPAHQTEPPAQADEALPVEGQPPADPCRDEADLARGWIDRLQQRLATTVCGSAVWFDGFFGDTSSVDPRLFYGSVAGGFLYKTDVEWEWKSRFDINFPLPNFERKTNIFLGRADEDDYISDAEYGPGDEIGTIGTQTGEDWLAGLGYTGMRTARSRLDYRLGVKVSSNPYLFGQARYRFLHQVSENRAWQVNETLFYRTDDDGFGSTTSFTYDWRLRRELLGRSSATATVSQDTDGVKWKYQAILYQNLGGWRGRESAMAYKYLINGETHAIASVEEYGFLATYRQQFYRPWLFAETTLGYSWVRNEDTGYERTGAVNVGILVDIRFGERVGTTP